ncbi:MAG: response regulator transcription factor [Actinobacteria bacterium]|nr:MAG: response regulator transcription factor [Actinomycetota bacterium]
MIRVVIADDQRVVRDGLTMLVGLIDDFEVVGAASDGAEAVDLARDTRPDVVLMDLRMPEMDGTEATHQIRSSLPETQVLVLTTYADDESLFPALQAGASGYLTKDASAEEIESAIRAVASGRTHLDPAIQQRLIAAVVDATPDEHILPDDLTSREVEVLKLIAAGLSNAEIATALVVSGATVKTHVNHIFAKTGARDRAQAVRYAYQRGIT